MQLRRENGMKATGQQVHGSRMGGEKVGVVLQVGGEQGMAVVKPLDRLSWTTGQPERGGGHRLEVPRLASFAGAKRSQLAVLMGAAVTAGLREGVTGVTCLATVRPVSPRLMALPLELARGSGFSAGRVVVQGAPVESAHDFDARVDEGGIYSW